MAGQAEDDASVYLSDTEVMEELDYDSDATNMSVSISSETRDTVQNDADDSDVDIEDIDETEAGRESPVIGERILQDGMVLSQRLLERAGTPILEPGVRHRAGTPAFVNETDSEEEGDDVIEHDSTQQRISSPLQPVIAREDVDSSSSASVALGENADSDTRHSVDVGQSSDDSIQSNLNSRLSPIPAQLTSDRSSPLPGQSTSDSRSSPLPGHSTSESMSSPLPGQSTSDSNAPLVPDQSTSSNPLPGQSTSSVRSSPVLGHSTSDGRLSPLPGHSTSGASHLQVPEQSTSDTHMQSELGTNEVEQFTGNNSSKKDENKTPKKKRSAVVVPMSPESDDEGQICSICFEPWANSGGHRLASLKCGHMFGNSCIERWLKGQGGKCPQCNAKATRKDIRVLYAKSLKVLDTSERDRVVKELEKEKEARRKLELEHAQTRLQYELKSKLVVKLQNELKMLRNATLGSSINLSQRKDSMEASSSGTNNRLVIYSALDLMKDGGCRVMAYNEWLNMVVVSMPSQVSMFPGSGIKKINMLDVKPERYIPIHQKQIRDLAFNPAKNDLLLTVGMDKLVKLTNVCNNAAVGSFTADAPLWSCCWNADQANCFFVGTAAGSVIMYDTRNTTGPIQTFKVAGSGPVVSMCYVPFKASANFSTGGLLVARLSSCSFVIVKEDGFKDFPLLLEGPFTSISFEKSTRHLLVSCRPSQKYPHARHLVCELQSVNVSIDAGALNQVITANPVQTFRGGTTQKVLSRSCLVAHPLQAGSVLACASDESTQSTCIWDVSSGVCVQQLKCKETVIDVIQIKSNETAYLALLTDKSVKFYKWIEGL